VLAHLSLSVIHHLLICPLSKLGIGSRIIIRALRLMGMDRVGLCGVVLVLILVK
jgi:hypothetical protein